MLRVAGFIHTRFCCNKYVSLSMVHFRRFYVRISRSSKSLDRGIDRFRGAACTGVASVVFAVGASVVFAAAASGLLAV